ncbi:hypothetical protein JHC27_03900 [archaeon]|nr:hypothetical protein [archaeon]
MKSTKVGITMLLDERKHVYPQYYEKCLSIVKNWANFIENEVKFIDGTHPDVIVSSKLISSISSAREVGEEFVSKGVRQVIIVYNVWNFPYLVWPFLNTVGKDKPILNLSNNEGKYPGNVGLLATDGALRQAGFRTHRIVETQMTLKLSRR